MKVREWGMIATFIVGHLSGAVLADTVPEAAVGAVLASALAVGLIEIVERTGVVESV